MRKKSNKGGRKRSITKSRSKENREISSASQGIDSAKKFERELSETRKEQMGFIQTLNKFNSTSTGKLTLGDRKTIVEQALILLEGAYVHLPLKRAMHAVDPIRRLRILQHTLDETTTNKMNPELDFHKEILDIFTSLRDLHTNYSLPKPFSDHFAFLPFQVESYVKNNKRQFLVTNTMEDYKNIFPATFKPGVDITYWNGVPMERAVEINANKNAGSNSAASFARGLESMTFRPIIASLPPDEEWVVIGYRTEDGLDLEYRQDWLVYSRDLADVTFDTRSATSTYSYEIGLDFTTDLVRQMKQILFAPQIVMERDQRLARARSVESLIEKAEGLESVMPKVFLAKKISEDVGYIRIFTFMVNSDVDFIKEFLRLIEQLPKKGLIIDVRGNGGGLITAAERLLQVLTSRKITPQPFQFISSPLTLEMTRKTPFLKPWELALSESVVTGSIFSRGFPITEIDDANNLGQKYFGPVLLVTDALCYSATDLFAAGFQDHKIGPVLGIDENTGAGGANVWEHGLLQQILAGTKYPLKTLPSGSNMRVSIRRNVRVGEYAGTPIEDLGITPDIKYNMSRRDLLEGNEDLIKKGSEILASMPIRQLDVVLDHQAGSLGIELTTLGISRIDIYVDGRPILSQNMADGTNKITIDRPKAGEKVLDIVGLKTNEVVAARKVFL